MHVELSTLTKWMSPTTMAGFIKDIQGTIELIGDSREFTSEREVQMMLEVGTEIRLALIANSGEEDAESYIEQAP